MKRLAAGAAAAALWLLVAGSALAADSVPAGPPFPSPVVGRAVYDTAGIFGADSVSAAEKAIAALQTRSGVAVVVYTQVKPESDTFWKADEDAKALLDQWQVGGASGNGLVILFDVAADRLVDNVSLVAGAGAQDRISIADIARIHYTAMEPLLTQGKPDEALAVGLARVQALLAPPAGPPYPVGDPSQRVYDFAGIFSPSTVAEAERIVADIQTRTGAVVVVYTQVKPESDDLDKANADARALMDQWRIGRKGFDDGLVILFDMQENLRHGQVSLYAGAGYRAAFLSDSDRQSIFDDQMKPLLVAGDMDGGLMAALHAVDANATPAHAADLQRGRQINAVISVAALLVGLLLALAAFASWLRHGRDPIYLDDPSILMPAPPDGLTPAMATVILDDRSSRRTTSAALLDLAAHRSIAFRQEKVRNPKDAGIEYKGEGDGEIRPPEARLLDSISANSVGHDQYIASKRLYHLTDAFGRLNSDLEKKAVQLGWIREEPGNVTMRWGLIGGLEVTAALVIGFVWLPFQASMLFVLAASILAAGIFTLAISRYMPARTKQGAILNAQLLAYKRTLGYSMVQSGSMNEAVQRHAVPWITTPDQLMVWAAAFGLNRELELLLGRTMGGPAGESGSTPAWSPSWWTVAGSSGHSGGHGSAAGLSAGLFSSSGFPDPGSIMTALGSITSPSSPVSSSSGSSSSSFSSGSFGGGGGGGGGGAGGGF